MRTCQRSSTKARHISPTGFGLVSVSRWGFFVGLFFWGGLFVYLFGVVFYPRPVLPPVFLVAGAAGKETFTRHFFPLQP